MTDKTDEAVAWIDAATLDYLRAAQKDQVTRISVLAFGLGAVSTHEKGSLIFSASSLASRDARIAELEALLEEAVKGLKVINEIWVEAKRHSPDDDFDRGSRAARAEASDLASATLTAIKGGE